MSSGCECYLSIVSRNIGMKGIREMETAETYHFCCMGRQFGEKGTVIKVTLNIKLCIHI